MKKLILFLLLFVFCSASSVSFAEVTKVSVLYTGETHSMLYPCDCSLGLSGGVAKRATKINQIRRKSQNVLLVDSGGTFSGGLLDEYSQSVKLDKQRTLINLEAMRIMGYDAIALGDEEFNFGEDFLKNAIIQKEAPFISSNIEADYIRPFIIKEINDIKVGILGLTTKVVKQRGADIKHIDPRKALEINIGNLRQQGVDIILVLSHLDEDESLLLLKKVEGVDILVTGHRLKDSPGPEERIGETIILRPAWQGRRLGRLDLELEDGAITNFAINDIKIEMDIKDDKKILAVLPDCFSDRDCRKKGFSANCEDPAASFAKCAFKKIKPVSLLIIRPKVCFTCDIDTATSRLEEALGNIKVSYLNYETRKGRQLVRDLEIDMLPAYILDKDVENNINFSRFSKFLQPRNDKYLVDPAVVGVSVFLGRKIDKGNLDLFVSLFNQNASLLLERAREVVEAKNKFNFNLHFLGVIEEDKNIVTPYGLAELEENMRSVCVMNRYPDKWWDYLLCRAETIESTWWDDCLESCGLNVNAIKQCSNSEEGKRYLFENMSLSSELKIGASGTFLVNNQRVFGVAEVPETKELEKVLERMIK